MGGEPVGVEVARATILGRPELEPVAPSEVRIPAGQAFELRLMYDLQEASAEKEQYLFELTSRVGDRREQTKNVRYGDTWGLPHSVLGYVAQPYTLETPGGYDVTFTARAEYAQRKWLTRAEPKRERRTVDGRLRITIE